MKKLLYSILLLTTLAVELVAHEDNCTQPHEHIEEQIDPSIEKSSVLEKDELKEFEKQAMNSEYKELLEAATLVRENAYVPYSKFKVGAAILTEDGKIFTGTNVENASYGLTVCAERCAIFKAVSEGYKNFKAIAVVLEDEGPGRPCGACRQVIREFGKDIVVIMSNLNGDIDIEPISNLLPKEFALDQNKE